MAAPDVVLPTLSLDQLMDNPAAMQGALAPEADAGVRELLEELSALRVADQIAMVRCLAASFYRHGLFTPYAFLHILRTRMRALYAREVIHEADDLADALSSETRGFKRHRRRVLDQMLEEEWAVHCYLTRANGRVDEDNVLSTTEELLRAFARQGCYRSLSMLKILALQHDDLAALIRRRICAVRRRAHARTRTVAV
ncbi:NF-kB inhibitor [Equine parapoxvirus]|nr:NF-kB inhibitor [Equine parapoxvirus]